MGLRRNALRTTLIINLGILGAIVFSDYGRKAASWERLIRPLIICATVVPLFVSSIPSTGHSSGLQFLGVAAGVVVGLVAMCFAEVDHQTPTGEPATRTAKTYAAIWIVVSLARIVFAWGSQHSRTGLPFTRGQMR